MRGYGDSRFLSAKAVKIRDTAKKRLAEELLNVLTDEDYKLNEDDIETVRLAKEQLEIMPIRGEESPDAARRRAITELKSRLMPSPRQLFDSASKLLGRYINGTAAEEKAQREANLKVIHAQALQEQQQALQDDIKGEKAAEREAAAAAEAGALGQRFALRQKIWG